jgi:hypothetical protein
MANQHCANCEAYIGDDAVCPRETGVSGIYFPNGFDILLCENCFLGEEALIDNEGSNDHPLRLARYLRTIERLG